MQIFGGGRCKENLDMKTRHLQFYEWIAARQHLLVQYLGF